MVDAATRLQEYASARALTVAAVVPLSQAQLDFRARPDTWSVGEIADHLLLAEALYRGEVEALVALARAGQPTYRKHSFADVNVSPLFLPDAVLSALEVPLACVNRLMPESVRSFVTEFPLLPTRNPTFATPRPGRPAAELKADLAESMAKTRALIEANADLDFEQLVSEHPVTGRTTVAQILGFLALHERRHQGQMEGVRQVPAFPTA